MKRNIIHLSILILMAAITLPASAIDRAKLIEYASSLKGLKKAELKTAISKRCQPQKTLAYGQGSAKTWGAGFYKTDRNYDTDECINRYSTKKFYFPANYSGSAVSGMNIEHSFPKSWWGGTENSAYKDLFNLYPSESDANSKKSNYPMGAVTNPSILNSYEKVGTGPAGSFGSIKLCEPADEWKGDFCRSYFYMATIYQNLTWAGTEGKQQLVKGEWPTLQEWAYTQYLDWVRDDVVTNIEVQRNDAIYSIQGNRNLFIDYPFLCEYVWGDSIDVEFNPYTSVTTCPDDPRYTGYPSDPSDPQDPSVPSDPSDPSTPSDPQDPSDPPSNYYFAETFDKCITNASTNFTGGNDGNWTGSIANGPLSDSKFDNSGWSYKTASGASECVRIGTSSTAGSITTPAIKGLNGKTVTLYFMAGAWGGTGENTTLTLSVTGATLTPSTVTLEPGKWNNYAVTLTGTSDQVTITFQGTGTKNRFFLDEVTIPYVPEPTLITISDITDLIDRYLNNDTEVTIESITTLIDQYLAQ